MYVFKTKLFTHARFRNADYTDKYNHCDHDLILIFKSKSQIAACKMNLLTEHFPVYDRNNYLNAEKTKS